ncbi:MAG TPA: AMP-binding protein, partial [Ktedonobacteraceae bacterium]|nr:AMP-binding protein [Ktedonobacteraceae bacterium]
TLVPLAPDASEEERARAVKIFKLDVLFVEKAEDAEGFGPLDATVMTRQACETLLRQASSTHLEHENMTSMQGHVCLMTSGTSGEPKGVVLTESQVAWTAEHIRVSHRISPQDRGLTVLPFFHVNAPVVSLCSSLMAGSTVVIARHFSRKHFWSWVESYEITWASIVPTILAMLLTTEKPTFLPSVLRFVRTASAPLPVAHLQAFEEKFGIPVIETYGLSEAASQVVANPVPPGKHKAGTVGFPVGVSLRISHQRQDENSHALQDVAAGETGEICIKGPSLIRSYWGNRGEDSFEGNWFRTGDLGYLDKDGYLHITGRLRDVIIRGGENIAPREVEEVLHVHPAVQDVAIVGRPDTIYGEQVVAYVVLNDEWQRNHDNAVESLRRFASQKLSPHKLPADFIVLDALPKNLTGKVDRLTLREDSLHHLSVRGAR